MPAIQLVILPLAADYEVKNIRIGIVDHDRSSFSRLLISSITSSGYFELNAFTPGFDDALVLVEEDKADLILEIPQGFERNLVRDGAQELFVAVNAINGVKANLGSSYLNRIIKTYNEDIRVDLLALPQESAGIEVTSAYWFNSLLNYRMFMVPGILALLVTMIGGFLSCLNIVKEKEIGTIEQINVTPIRKHHFILGKLIPFWILGNVVFTIGLLLSWLVYGIVPAGSLAVLYAFIAVYLLCVLGLGLLVSTFCETQQQAMFIMFFFMMVFILMGGLFTSVDSMPEWAKWFSRLNPLSYLINVMRMVILKGSGFADVAHHLFVVTVFAIILNLWAVVNYKKTSG
jgi:ABC-2 type transport system permease protein